jgi:hypothetical protein
MWQTIIHITFILSAVGIAYVDRLSGGNTGVSHRAQSAHGRSARLTPTARDEPAAPIAGTTPPDRA